MEMDVVEYMNKMIILQINYLVLWPEEEENSLNLSNDQINLVIY